MILFLSPVHPKTSIGQKISRAVFTGRGRLRKGVRVPLLGEGFGVGFGGVIGGGFPAENKAQGEGGGEGGGWRVGWGPAKEPASQCASFVETTL